MPKGDTTDTRLGRLEEGLDSLHDKVDKLANSLDNHVATDVKRMVKAMGAVISVLLGVLGTLLWPYFSGGP